MKILFVENRQQTYFWEAVAVRLEQDGHEIHWIVQNAGFSPSTGIILRIPYPKGRRTQWAAPPDEELQRISSTDRNINYFGGDWSHYAHYESEIGRILDYVEPDIVFGEATLFHELLCIRDCRKRGILYLVPTSCRYPTGRFSFYMYDTQTPFAGSNEAYAEPRSREMADDIASRKIVPDYVKMGRPGGIFRTKVRALCNGLRVVAFHLIGERYNTPPPVCKFKLELQSRNNKRNWERLVSRRRATAGRFRILYPLQVQPESNIDVWGNCYHDQVKLLSSLQRMVGDDAVIIVKPNPKSKYEMSGDLVELVASYECFHPVSYATSMGDVLRTVDLIVTVTGTVAIEAIFSGMPTVTLMKTLNNSIPQCVYLKDLCELPSVMRQVRDGTFPRATEKQKVAFLNLLVRTSYCGIISNPYSNPSCVSDENIRHVHFAFKHVLRDNRLNVKENKRWEIPSKWVTSDTRTEEGFRFS